MKRKKNAIKRKIKVMEIIFSIYQFIEHIPHPNTAESARITAKKRDKKERTEKKRIRIEGETIHHNPGN